MLPKIVLVPLEAVELPLAKYWGIKPEIPWTLLRLKMFLVEITLFSTTEYVETEGPDAQRKCDCVGVKANAVTGPT